jgi:hypothetical protein
LDSYVRDIGSHIPTLRHYHENKLFETLLGEHVVRACEEERKQRQGFGAFGDDDIKVNQMISVTIFVMAVAATESAMLDILQPDKLTLGKSISVHVVVFLLMMDYDHV